MVQATKDRHLCLELRHSLSRQTCARGRGEAWEGAFRRMGAPRRHTPGHGVCAAQMPCVPPSPLSPKHTHPGAVDSCPLPSACSPHLHGVSPPIQAFDGHGRAVQHASVDGPISAGAQQVALGETLVGSGHGTDRARAASLTVVRGSRTLASEHPRTGLVRESDGAAKPALRLYVRARNLSGFFELLVGVLPSCGARGSGAGGVHDGRGRVPRALAHATLGQQPLLQHAAARAGRVASQGQVS